MNLPKTAVLADALPPNVKAGIKRLTLGPRLVRNFLYDLLRYLRWSAVRGRRYKEHLQAAMVIDYHRLEKGLSLPEPRPGFGQVVAKRLVEASSAYEESYGRDDHLDVVLNVLGAYADFLEPSSASTARLQLQIRELIGRAKTRPGQRGSGGVALFSRDEIQRLAGGNIKEALQSRHSIRTFEPGSVPLGSIRAAVDVARYSPSVCNRQAWRVRVFDHPADREAILALQNGNRGFGHGAAAVLVVSVDQRFFTSVGERNQGWIDGGIFSMSLALGLHHEGLGSCFLNWSVEADRDIALRKALGLPPSESVVVLLAVGRLPSEVSVPHSTRRPVDAVLLEQGVQSRKAS